MMNKRPYISIVIVCYNYGHLLSKALQQIQIQKFRDFEIVFVDNGCTDNSLAVMKVFDANMPDINVKYVTIEKNIGLAYGDNKGVEAANGEYLMFHDADDWMDEDTLQLLADAAKNNNADRVIPAIRDVDDNGEIIQTQNLGEKPSYWLYNLVQGNLFRTDLYKQLGITTQTFSPDVEKTFWFSAYTTIAAFVHEPCYNMLVHQNSTSHRRDYYKNILSDGNYSTENLLTLCLRWLPDDTSDNHFMAVYALARVYYGHIFRFLRYAPLKDTFIIYNKINGFMRKKIPDYLSCTKKAVKLKGTTRLYGRMVAMMFCYLEYLHLMRPALFCYHFLSKIVYFVE